MDDFMEKCTYKKEEGLLKKYFCNNCFFLLTIYITFF